VVVSNMLRNTINGRECVDMMCAAEARKEQKVK
jgi:hypothetical protein